jgi:hypothetical protein
MIDFLLRVLLAIIAAITVFTGLLQLVAPAWMLGFIAHDQTALTAHFFATIGMFMVITGALFLQSLLVRSTEPAIPFWIGVQKAAAAALVAWAVIRGLMLPLAYLVASFDAITAVFVFAFWRRLAR